MSSEPIVSQKKTPSDDVPRRMLTLLLELLKSDGELPDLAIGGAFIGVVWCLTGRPSLGPTAVECGIFQISVSHLRKRHASAAPWTG